MVLRPRGVQDWFDAVPTLLSDAAWDVEVLQGSASLAHCPCLWGGRLVRVIVFGITVRDPPENKSYVPLVGLVSCLSEPLAEAFHAH